MATGFVQGSLDSLPIQMTPAGAQVLIGANQIAGTGLGVVTLTQHILAVDDAALGLGSAGASGPDTQAGQETLGDQFVYHFRLAGLAFAKFQQGEAAAQLAQPPALLTVLFYRCIGDAGS